MQQAHETLLPPAISGAITEFQKWHLYDSTAGSWKAVDATDYEARGNQTPDGDLQKLSLVTWNIDAFAKHPELRIAGIISKIKTLNPLPQVIFLQEVSEEALTWLLSDGWIRDEWISSGADHSQWRGISFATVTLLSKSQFLYRNPTSMQAVLGSVWRIKYPSRFGRDALCCDILLPHTTSPDKAKRVRLINVHLDSLQTEPSLRPRQLEINASLLGVAGCGLIAGDFNPVLPEDKTLIERNNLVDAWKEIHANEPGFTWGIDGRAPYPPVRLDKIALLELKAVEIEVLNPGWVKWAACSDHSGLKCTVRVSDD